MAVIITVGVNSWITQAEATSYFEEKWEAAAWATLTDLQKKQLIISAYRWINQQFNLSIPAASTLAVVKNAQCEAAWFIYSYWSAYDKRRALDASGVKSFSIGQGFSESLNGVEFPAFISDMLIDFVVNSGGCFPRIERELSDD